ncbi:MAG: NifB/NifX family molybdenum-iron cluster-binding protein [Pseudomonadota bacterium]
MRVALPYWHGRVSPVFDVAQDLLVVDIEKSVESQRESRALIYADPWRRAGELAGLGTDVLICGAISRVLEAALTRSGVKVIGFVCGNIEEVVSAFMDGDIMSPRFWMPGRCSRKRRVGIRRAAVKTENND